jgi:hypothetical protein
VRARHTNYDSGKVLLPERMAIQRYMDWKKYRLEEGDGKDCFPTFAEWLAQSQIVVLPPEWPQNSSERSFLSHPASR